MDMQPVLQLTEAARSGDAAGLAAALEAAAALYDPASPSQLRNKALDEACGGGHTGCARQLLNAGADPNSVVHREGQHWRPLHSASAAGVSPSLACEQCTAVKLA